MTGPGEEVVEVYMAEQGRGLVEQCKDMLKSEEEHEDKTPYDRGEDRFGEEYGGARYKYERYRRIPTTMALAE